MLTEVDNLIPNPRGPLYFCNSAFFRFYKLNTEYVPWRRNPFQRSYSETCRERQEEEATSLQVRSGFIAQSVFAKPRFKKNKNPHTRFQRLNFRVEDWMYFQLRVTGKETGTP